jgi:hypothetical protein
MATIETRIKELIQFYVRTNYEDYLKENSLQVISNEDIPDVITQLYTDRKDHLKGFIKGSLRQLMENDYPGDLVVLNILISVFEDDQLCINRLIMEIKVYQGQFSHK